MKADWYLEAVAEDEGDLPYGDKIRAALTPDEYQTLLRWMNRKHKRSSKVDVIQVAVDFILAESFAPQKVAVAETAKRHHIARSSVYDARRKFLRAIQSK